MTEIKVNLEGLVENVAQLLHEKKELMRALEIATIEIYQCPPKNKFERNTQKAKSKSWIDEAKLELESTK